MEETAPKGKRREMVAWSLLGASLAAMFSSVYLGFEQIEHQKCQALVNDSFSRALSARTVAAEQDRSALDKMIEDVTKAKSPADTRAALELYRATRAKADQERKEHPLPRPASETC